MDFTRRALLAKTLGALGTVSAVKAVAAVCGPTHRQTEGPYYPERDLNRDNDLTQFKAGTAARGEVIDIKGQVMGVDCKPIIGAEVEI